MAVQASSSSSYRVPIAPGTADDDSLQLFRQMAHTFLKLQRRVEDYLAPHGLVLSQFEALAKIGFKPGMIQQELVQHLVVTKGNVGALLDRLETAGLVERRADPADRRANRLLLTERGETLVTELFATHLKLAREMFSPLSAGQRRTLTGLLKLVEPD